VDETTVLSAVDMFPSLCTIAGGQLPANAMSDGQDMSEAWLGKPIERGKPLFWEYGRNPRSFDYPRGRDRSPSIATREGKWKLLVNADETGAELYDLQADPNETKDVAADQPEIAKRLTKSALDWFQSKPPPPPEKQ